jgi:hypothetical protein
MLPVVPRHTHNHTECTFTHTPNSFSPHCCATQFTMPPPCHLLICAPLLPAVQDNAQPLLLLSHKYDLRAPLQLCQGFLLQLFRPDMYHSLPKAQLSSMRPWLRTAQQLHLQELEEAVRACMFDCLVKVAPRYCSRCRRWGGFSECSACSGWQERGVKAIDEVIAQWVFGTGRQSEKGSVQKGMLIKCGGDGVCPGGDGKGAGGNKVKGAARRCECGECSSSGKAGEAAAQAGLLLGVQQWGELLVHMMAV